MRSTCPMAKACRVPRRSRSGGTGAPGGISPEPRLLKRVTLLPPSIPLAEAKNKLSELIDRVSRGEAIVISRHPTDMARLVPIGRAPRSDINASIATLHATRKRRVARVEELLQWRNEGRC